MVATRGALLALHIRIPCGLVGTVEDVYTGDLGTRGFRLRGAGSDLAADDRNDLRSAPTEDTEINDKCSGKAIRSVTGVAAKAGQPTMAVFAPKCMR